MHNLHGFQEDIIEALREGFRNSHRRQMLAAATGSGKTVITSALVHSAAQKGTRSLFIVDRIELVGQAVRHLDALGLKVVILQGENTDLRPDDEVVVASIQTIRTRGVGPAGLIVIDEAHVLHKAHISLFQGWDRVPVIGLSATPLREDLGKYFTNLVRGLSILQLIADGYLVRPVVYCPHAEDARRLVADVAVSHGEFSNAQLSERLNRKELVGDIIRTWQEKAAGLKTIVFCVDVAHSKAVCDDFLTAGVTAEQLDYKTARTDRAEIGGRFRSGETQVLTSVNVLGTGFDVPDVGAAILARPTLSEALFIQQVGRALRTSPGKDKAIILDHAANTLRFGLPQDFIVPDLSDGDHKSGSKKQQADHLLTCGECGAVMEVGQGICPACGIERPTRQTEVHYIDAELVEHGADRTDAGPSDDDKRHWYAGLKQYAEQRGYSSGWAYHKFNEKFGHHPRNEWRWIPPQPPTIEMQRWIKSRQIAFAKSQEKKASPKAQRPCPKCGSTTTAPGPGAGPHAARLNCASCGAFVQWLPKRQA